MLFKHAVLFFLRRQEKWTKHNGNPSLVSLRYFKTPFISIISLYIMKEHHLSNMQSLIKYREAPSGDYNLICALNNSPHNEAEFCPKDYHTHCFCKKSAKTTFLLAKMQVFQAAKSFPCLIQRESLVVCAWSYIILRVHGKAKNRAHQQPKGLARAAMRTHRAMNA
jgi:hypothetical protein